MDPTATGRGLPSDPSAPGRQPWARAATWIAQAAAMAAVVTVGVAALSFFPHRDSHCPGGVKAGAARNR